MRYEHAPLVGEHLKRWMVALFLEEECIGTGILFRDQGVLFVLSARHVFYDDDGERRAGALRISTATGEGYQSQFELRHFAIGSIEGTDAAVVPMPLLHASSAQLLERACDGRDLLLREPRDGSLASTEVFIAGFPRELSYIDEEQTSLAPFLYASRLPPAGLKLPVPSFLAWIPPDGVWNLATAEDVKMPQLDGVSGGPWLVVDTSGDRPAVKIIATHSRRVVLVRDDSEEAIASGCPIENHVHLVMSAIEGRRRGVR